MKVASGTCTGTFRPVWVLGLFAALTLAAMASACDTDSPPATAEQDAFPNPNEATETWIGRMVVCLQAAGFAAEQGPGQAAYSVPGLAADQRNAFIWTREACEALLGPHPKEQGSRPSNREIKRIYDELLGVKACLEAEGIEISEPPHFNRFLTSWETGPWHPYMELSRLDAKEFERLNDACPQP